jgi:hypothetical protein
MTAAGARPASRAKRLDISKVSVYVCPAHGSERPWGVVDISVGLGLGLLWPGLCIIGRGSLGEDPVLELREKCFA